MNKNITKIISTIMLLTCVACQEPQLQSTPEPDGNSNYDMDGFIRGADVSWLTEQEASDVNFYNADGEKEECMHLMRDLGMNAIRLRVWVNPTNGWCNKDDVLVKAYRASKLGFRLLIDFHYSDDWADPTNQNPPAAWTDYNLEEMEAAVSEHTTEVLNMLKSYNIDVEWVQVGNETRYGMLFPLGNTSGGDFTGYAALNNAGYDAVKSVYPDAKVIVHVDRGHQISGFTYHFDGLKAAGGKWDVIGMSFYPYWDSSYTGSNWMDFNDAIIENMKTLISRYGKEVMIVEVGTTWNDSYGYDMFDNLISRSKEIPECLGVLYWEPQCYNGWKNYQLGAFDNNGMPTEIMNAFQAD